MTPTVLQLEEERFVEQNRSNRANASDADIQQYLVRCNLTHDAQHMSTFRGQPAVNTKDAGVPVYLPGKQVLYYPLQRLVSYEEYFLSSDNFLKRGYRVVFEVDDDGDFCETRIAARKLLSGQIDPHRIIRDTCMRENLKLKFAHGACAASFRYGMRVYSGTLWQRYLFPVKFKTC